MFAIDFTTFSINTLYGPMYLPSLPQSVYTLVPFTGRTPVIDYNFVPLVLCDNLIPTKYNSGTTNCDSIK